MPIGVPRIIYCWGEELPPQWTDIYNFIFRRRMVFLMQYLDDELCNQICGLLINIHMEDRNNELEKKEMEKSGVFRNDMKFSPGTSEGTDSSSENPSGEGTRNKNTFQGTNKSNIKNYAEDLLISEQDLSIKDNHTLGRYTLQKITVQWLTWNAQFFNYEDEPYFYYLAQIVSQDFNKQTGRLIYNLEMERLMKIFKNMSSVSSKLKSKILFKNLASFSEANQVTPSNNNMLRSGSDSFATTTNSPTTVGGFKSYETVIDNKDFSHESLGSLPAIDFAPLAPRFAITKNESSVGSNFARMEGNIKNNIPQFSKKHFDVYSPFRLIANFSSGKYSFKQLFPTISDEKSSNGKFSQQSVSTMPSNNLNEANGSNQWLAKKAMINGTVANHPEELISNVAKSSFSVSKALLEDPNTLSGLTAGVEKIKLHVGKKDFFAKSQNYAAQIKASEKSLSEKFLKSQYRQAHSKNTVMTPSLVLGTKSASLLSKSKRGSLPNTSNPSWGSLNEGKGGNPKYDPKANYLDFNTFTNQNFGNYNSYYRKQTERILQEEESKKVFVIINSFGGSVGNGITLHDALQFIKAGSLTLALGVAASAASLALAGGTVGERFDLI